MFFRKLVLTLYIFQTFVSSIPVPCYGMELDDSIANSVNPRPNLQEPFGNDESPILEDDPLLSPSKKRNSRVQKSKATEITDPNVLLNGYLNYYLNCEKSRLFPKYSQQFNTTLQVTTGLIIANKKPKNEDPFDWDKGMVLLKEIDKRFVQGNSPKSLPLEWPWAILKGAGILGCSGIMILYTASPFGIDPTRLYLINSALPLEIQSAVAIGFSAGFASYHVLPHAMEGLNTSMRLYRRFFQNWGVSDTHGFMTSADDEHSELRDLVTLRDQQKREGILEASGWEKIQENVNTKVHVLQEPHITDIAWKYEFSSEPFEEKGTVPQRAQMTEKEREEEQRLKQLYEKKQECKKSFIETMTDLTGKTVKYGVLGFVGIMYALLYSLTFLEAEEFNAQSLYGYFFVGSVFSFIFGTTVHNGWTEWEWSNHKRANKEMLNNKKKTLMQTLDKTKEFINSKTQNSEDFVEEVYNRYTKQEQAEEEFSLSKFSLLFLKVSYENSPESLEALTLKTTKPHKSWLKSVAEKVGTFGVGAWAIPAFFVFWNVANNTLKYAGIPEDFAYWASIPVSGLVSGFGIMEGWKQEPRIHAKLLDHLSPAHPLFLLKFLFFSTSSFSALWSTSSYIGVLSDLLGTSLSLAKYTLYSLSLFSIPKFLLWEVERWDDLMRLILTNSFITRYVNTTRQKRLYLNHEIERAKEAIFEWDGETTDQFTHFLWDIT
ncbi:MAG: hypothetical protein H0X26_06670 [Alphaproteobacteria bacterium]|nr:hypothetical protein [Alphaproteobacteria bacterium]